MQDIARTSAILVWLMLIAGVQLWLLLGRGMFGRDAHVWILPAVLGVVLVPRVRRGLFAGIEKLRRPSARLEGNISIALVLCAAAYFYMSARGQGRDFLPKFEDEYSYLLQARMLASGRLWMPQHELARFFDTFQVIVDPVYASAYFPGTAMLMVPGVWLGLPHWGTGVLIASAIVALTFRVTTAILHDAAAGLLAALMMMALPELRKQSVMVLAHLPVLFMGLMAVHGYLRWRETGRVVWAAVIGAAAGWAAITRPLDAVALVAPVGIAMLWSQRRRCGVDQSRRALTVAVLAALPFLAVQLWFNAGVTGRWWYTPFQLYHARDVPNTGVGFFAYDPVKRPVSDVPQKHALYVDSVLPLIYAHPPDAALGTLLTTRLPQTVLFNVPHPLLLVLLPAGLLALANRRALLVWLALPLFAALYSLYTFWLPNYTIVAAPAVVLIILLGVRTLEHAWPAGRAGVVTFLVLMVAALSIAQLPEMNRVVQDELFSPREYAHVNSALATLPRRPAVVLFTFDPEVDNPHIEHVYNVQTAWPDDAQVVRAHDRGSAENLRLLAYYAARRPQRAIYRYTRATGELNYLGTAAELAGRTTTADEPVKP